MSAEALAVLKVLRKEWEMATADLRNESGVKDRKAFTRAIDDLQAAMIVVPSDVVYQPSSATSGRWPKGGFPNNWRRRSIAKLRSARSRDAFWTAPA